MCDQNENISEPAKDFFNNENFKSCFARSVAVNSQYNQTKTVDLRTETNGRNVEDNDTFTNKNSANGSQEMPVRYRKNTRSASMDDSRRFSWGSIVSRRATTIIPKRIEIPVENIYNQNKIETLQWQLKEIEKSREMYQAVMKEVVIFLEKAHISLEHLGNRLNRKNSVPRSKSEHHIVADNSNSHQSQRSLIEEHLSSWNSTNKHDLHPDEIPPDKLSKEAFRLLRTSQSLLNTREPKLASSEDLNASDEPSDIQFLAQLAREFRSDDQKPQRTTSFSLSPKLIRPEHDVRIYTAFNRKLSLQLSEVRRSSVATDTFLRTDSARTSVAESEASFSLPPCIEVLPRQIDPLRTGGTDVGEKGSQKVEKTSTSPATTSISSMEDESGFSSMNSFQDIGVPLVNSTGIDDVSARSVLLKSMIHNNSDFQSLNDSEPSGCFSETTLVDSPRSERRYEKISEQKRRDSKRSSTMDDRRFSYASEERSNSPSDVKLWQKPYQNRINIEEISSEKKNYTLSSQISHQRWHSTPDKQSGSQSLKVLWV